uniref:1-aminocyclopropane-1-carboxylate oxidase homolog 6-like n=1 Tax=Erigeron canadensis TaxID=72917 RepID=UPI001CB8B770|nr:1-aminocyclopropane-1-carboxylate oxidase homolog 6-like [Erigeron canadensis]
MTTSPTKHDENSYDRLTELKQFDESKLGVKGLLDSGITTIPRFFHQPPENLPFLKPKITKSKSTVPVIDLSLERSTVVDQIRKSASTVGFFQIVNHGVPVKVIESVINDMEKFYEESNEYKMKFYHRDAAKGAAYSTNFDLFQSQGASWRDTLQVRMGPLDPAWDLVPEICRAALADWDKAVAVLAEQLMSLLCEGLGIKSEKLKELLCLEGRLCISHYYPHCPQPELTMGITSHTDPGVLTMLVQNDVGGLQVKCGEDWVDVEVVPGAIVINIGDMLQIMSNDEYKSVEHRVLANNVERARISVVVFFNPSIREKTYGPFPELISAKKPAIYQELVLEEYMKRFFAKGIDGRTLTNVYRIHNTNG